MKKIQIGLFAFTLMACLPVMAQEPAEEKSGHTETNAVEAVALPDSQTSRQLKQVEQNVSEIQAQLGKRMVGSRSLSSSIEEQLADLERRLKQAERDIDDLERKVRRVERRN